MIRTLLQDVYLHHTVLDFFMGEYVDVSYRSSCDCNQHKTCTGQAEKDVEVESDT